MSDYGDFCREQRQSKQRLRAHWHECPTCAISFGTGTSVAPGGNCRNCGWRAPGDRGDDARAAKRLDDVRSKSKIDERKKKEARFKFCCPYCDRKLKNPSARGQHVQSSHREEHNEKRVKMGSRETF